MCSILFVFSGISSTLVGYSSWSLICVSLKSMTEDSRKHEVTILASEWGFKNGWVSTMIRELAIQLAKLSCVHITLFLLNCTDNDIKVAKSHGISIVKAKRRPGYNKVDWLSFPPGNLKIDVVVGHGVKFGHQAQAIRDSHNCKWVHVVHTDTEENQTSGSETEHQTEIDLCQMADLVVGVGPKLTEAFQTSLFPQKSVFELTPGIFADFAKVQHNPDKGKKRRVFLFGHGDDENLNLKGFDIAAKSVATLRNTDTELIFVVKDKTKFIDRINDLLGPQNHTTHFTLREYGYNPENLKQLFCQADLVLMPSRAEGFGLIGLEALSAGLPVIVSKNSGFGETLSSVLFGSFYVMDPEDPSEWTKAIEKILKKDRKLRLEEIEIVRDSYDKRYGWPEQCKGLIEKIVECLDGMSHFDSTCVLFKIVILKS